MLCLSRKTEYALIALAYLAEQTGRVASAREVARVHQLPLALLMNILKGLQAHRILASIRGVKGGYRIQHDLDSLSLYDFISIVECPGHIGDESCGCEQQSDLGRDLARFADSGGPVQALQLRLMRFLKQVRVADLVLPGRRIDVPVERLFSKDNSRNHRSLEHVDSVD